jgi:hypothetical protein
MKLLLLTGLLVGMFYLGRATVVTPQPAADGHAHGINCIDGSQF